VVVYIRVRGRGGDTFPAVEPSDRVYQRPYKRFNAAVRARVKTVSNCDADKAHRRRRRRRRYHDDKRTPEMSDGYYCIMFWKRKKKKTRKKKRRRRRRRVRKRTSIHNV